MPPILSIPKSALAAFLAAAAILPAPALAEESRTGEMVEKLNDPMTQYAVAGMLSAMTKAMLDMEIAPFMKAMEGVSGRRSNLPDDATVGDLAGTDSAQIRDELIERVPAMMSGAGQMAVALEGMIPQLEAMARKMKDAVPRR